MTVLAAGALVALAPARPRSRSARRQRRSSGSSGSSARSTRSSGRVFPKGRPADTAGFADDPAATQSSVMSLDQRLDALERQMADMLRQTEENGNRLRSLESGIGQLKADQEQRIQALEQRMSERRAAVPADNRRRACDGTATPPKPKPKPPTIPPKIVGDAAKPARRLRRRRRPRRPPPRRPGRGCLQRGLPPVGGRAITTRRSAR